MSGQLFVISAPSGTGKSTVAMAVRQRVPGLGYSISHTTRKPRGNERNGIDYHFVDDGTFTKMIDEGAFVEWAKVYDDFYGTAFLSLDEQTSPGYDVLLDLDAQGARSIRRAFEDSVLIYVLPPSLEILNKRLRDRGTDDEDAIRKRMESARDEIKNCVWYDYIVFNDDLEKAIGEVQSIIISERCRAGRQAQRAKELLDISVS